MSRQRKNTTPIGVHRPIPPIKTAVLHHRSFKAYSYTRLKDRGLEDYPVKTTIPRIDALKTPPVDRCPLNSNGIR